MRLGLCSSCVDDLGKRHKSGEAGRFVNCRVWGSETQRWPGFSGMCKHGEK